MLYKDMNKDLHTLSFRENLLSWYQVHRRTLPWRDNYNPYHTWIAEVMMQQTQMDRGVAYFQRWMDRFPDIASLAKASEEDLLKAWEGLGYYRRVRNIQAAARIIMERHGGVFPNTYTAILDLPGIGPYTAGAIASTAFNQDMPCVDGNVERVLSRVFNIDTPVRQEPAKSQILQLAQKLIPPGQARDFNQAIMELGALVCRKVPACSACPLYEQCESRHLGLAKKRPVPGRKATITRLDMVTGILIRSNHIFVQRRREDDIWGGLWEFPGGCVDPGESLEQAIVREWQEETGFTVRPVRRLVTIRHSYTTYRITLTAFLLDLMASDDANSRPSPPVLTEATAWRWLPIEEIGDIPLPAPHRKLTHVCPLLGKNKMNNSDKQHISSDVVTDAAHTQLSLPGLG